MIARVAWGAVVAILLAIGIASAVNRGLAVSSEDPSWIERQQLEFVAAVAGLQPGSPEHGRMTQEISRQAANMNSHPRASLGHLAAGVALFVLLSLQFSRRLRSRHRAVHRWNGRVLLTLAVVVAGAGIYLGVAEPYGGAWESLASTLFGGFFLLAGARGYAAIRRRDIARHREWMIRFFAVAIGISVIRMIGMGHFLLTGTQAIQPQAFAAQLWAGWLVSLALAEIWIRHTRGSRSVAPLHDLQPQ